LSRRLKALSDGDVMTSDGRALQTRGAAETAIARSPTLIRPVGGTCNSSVEAERSRRRQSMSATRHSWRATVQGRPTAEPCLAGSGRRVRQYRLIQELQWRGLYVSSTGLRWVLLILQHEAHSRNRPTATDEKSLLLFSSQLRQSSLQYLGLAGPTYRQHSTR